MKNSSNPSSQVIVIYGQSFSFVHFKSAYSALAILFIKQIIIFFRADPVSGSEIMVALVLCFVDPARLLYSYLSLMIFVCLPIMLGSCGTVGFLKLGILFPNAFLTPWTLSKPSARMIPILI